VYMVMLFKKGIWGKAISITVLIAVLLTFNLPVFAADPDDYPSSIDNGDGTYTYIFQPSEGANDGTDEGGLTSGKDAGVHEPSANTVVYWDSPSIGTWNSNCNNWHGWAYFQFDLDGLPDPADIISVDFKFYVVISRSYGWPYQLSTTTFDVYRNTSPWQENTITWNNRPSNAGIVEGTASISNTSSISPFFEGFVDVDITNLYQEWKDGTYTNYGFFVNRRQLICENANGTYISSSDNPDMLVRPALEITYTGGAPEDTTPPVITPTVVSTLGNNDWYTSDITVSWTVTDDESEITSITGGETTEINMDTAGVTLTCEATSAGGTASESVILKRDATPPVVTIITPGDGDEYEIGEAVDVDWEASDALSGLANAEGDIIDTSTAGTKTFTVTATDMAGNETTVTHTYDVLTPPWTIERLIAKVKSLNLHKGTEKSLIAKLNAAAKSLDKGRDNAAVNQLSAFVNKVEAQSGKKIGGADANDLMAAAEEIIAGISNGS